MDKKISRLLPSEEDDLIDGVRHTDSEDDVLHKQLRRWIMERWDEEVYDCENDVAGLCVSFLATQAFRFNISGNMPNNLGVEEENWIHDFKCVLILAGIGLLCAMGTMALVVVRSKVPDDVEPGSTTSLYKRIVIVSQNASAMCFAWCSLYAAKWEMCRLFVGLGAPNTLKSRVIMALIISLVSFFLIFLLDKAADSPGTGDLADLGIISIIGSFGILVGFAWEQSFDGGVEVIAELTPYPIVAQLGMAVLVAAVVVTPWRRYILDTLIKLAAHRAGIEQDLGAGLLGLAPHLESPEHRAQREQCRELAIALPRINDSPAKDHDADQAANAALQIQTERALEHSILLQRDKVVLEEQLQASNFTIQELRSQLINAELGSRIADRDAMRTTPELLEPLRPEVRQQVQGLQQDVQALEIQHNRDIGQLAELRELNFHSEVKLDILQRELQEQIAKNAEFDAENKKLKELTRQIAGYSMGRAA